MAVFSGGDRALGDAVVHKHRGGFAILVAGLERARVRLNQGRVLGVRVADPPHAGFQGTLEKPQCEAERKEASTAVRLVRNQIEPGHSLAIELGHWDCEYAVTF